jgi:hypothetical protein
MLGMQPSHAQQGQATQPKREQPKPKAQTPQLVVPSDDVLRILIRATLSALNQANATGNYTVFRELAAPAFQETNNPARLAEIFSNLRHRNVDLSPMLVMEPKLIRPPEINADNLLRITGFFPSVRAQLNFDLLFQPVQGHWLLFGVAADTTSVQPAATLAPADAPKAATKPATPPQSGRSPTPGPKAAGKATSSEDGEATVEQSSKPNVDIRDQVDNLENSSPSPPPAEKPNQNSTWNPFSR